MPKEETKRTIDEKVDLVTEITITRIPEVEKISDNEDVRGVFEDLIGKGDVKVQKALNYGEIEVIVSNSGLDRHGESITMEGIDLSQIRRNPVVLWAHEYSKLPIGQILKLWKSNGNLMAKIRLDYDIYDFANTVYQMVLRGTINAVSIGGIAREWSDDYTIIKKLEMIEVSFVPVGAHPDALVTAKSLNMNVDDLTKQYEDFMQKALVDKLKVLPQNELELHIKALKNLTSALESSYKDSADTDDTPTKRVKKLVILRQSAKQVDKQAELIIAAINQKLKS